MCHLSVVNSLMLLLSISYLSLVNCTQQETSNTPPLGFSKTRVLSGECFVSLVGDLALTILHPDQSTRRIGYTVSLQSSSSCA
ncbi:hypothetical protein CABS01_13912 [Colletotrichum abscissum]|uniref:Secreted protein n=1 Tax=Colletotrichum costaricense TaxID=1209916 RepID=A0AAI9YZA7_9PEZI|nr:uncharacterized protein CCOS01_06862 [Colletotrichum costaricense]XP_060394366.1 uncharacterized protein CABS01_13912 [Colletotrichum abscissum]KAK1483760.1 hypothetical protein CABS01_13912 [Colletotrichum abscissum]KAK1529028.1 hypothetical protein CCOS01_06862 [Colletotrichum costaricense]